MLRVNGGTKSTNFVFNLQPKKKDISQSFTHTHTHANTYILNK